MKKLLLLILCLQFSLIFNAQNVFYGYPSDDVELKGGDKIIVSIPDHWDGRFNNSKDLDELITYVCLSDLTFKIKVIVFRGTDEFSFAYSENLSHNLDKLLADKCSKSMYQIVPIGKTEPLYYDKSDIEKYYKYNTRIEIIIE